MSPWMETLKNAAIFVIIQALAFLIISTSSDIFSPKKKTKKRCFSLKLSHSVSHLLAFISDDVSQAEGVEEHEDNVYSLLKPDRNWFIFPGIWHCIFKKLTCPRKQNIQILLFTTYGSCKLKQRSDELSYDLYI